MILSGLETWPEFGSPFFILSINSIPLITLPKAEYCLSKCGAASKQIKNWLLALFGSADLAADNIPRVWAISENSAYKSGKSEPPVPAKDKLKLGLLEFPNFTSPVWAINPSITLWKTTPSYFPLSANSEIFSRD